MPVTADQWGHQALSGPFRQRGSPGSSDCSSENKKSARLDQSVEAGDDAKIPAWPFRCIIFEQFALDHFGGRIDGVVGLIGKRRGFTL